jgi:hypothetical protein
MTAQDYAVLGLIFASINGLVEVIKILVSGKKNGKSVPNNPINFHELKSSVDDMHEMMKKTDESGIPMCYTPRQIMKLQERQLDRLDTIIKLLSIEKA